MILISPDSASSHLKLIADGPSFSYEKLGTRNLYTSSIQVSHTRNMADGRDDKEFQLYFFRIAIYNQQNGQKDEKIRNN